MSLLASGWSRVYAAWIRGGTRGALVSVQNLVIAGSSGLVQHAALFFYSCMQSFHIMEEAWKSRCKCANGAVYKNGNFSVLPNGGGMFLFSATHWVFLFFIKKKGLCKFKKQIFGLFFSSRSFIVCKETKFLKLTLLWKHMSSVLSQTLVQSSSLQTQQTECYVDGIWMGNGFSSQCK